MTHKNYKKHVLFLFIICSAISISAGVILNQLISYENYRNMSSFITTLVINNSELNSPDIDQNFEKEVFLSLKESFGNPSRNDVDIDFNLMEKYGYTYKVFSGFTNQNIMLICLMCFLIIFLIFTIIMVLQRKRNLKRINLLSNYLNKINNTGYGELIYSIEDDFSMLEDEIYKTVTELKTTKESALRERNNLSDNLADISHQLKTPIAAMSLMVQLIDSVSEEDKAYIDKLKLQLDRIQYLVATLLKLSKIDSGVILFEKDNIDIYSLLCQTTEQMEPITIAKNQIIEFDETININIVGDRNWIVEAISNILKNCCEHTPIGGHINILYNDNPLYGEIIISDNGHGFHKEDIPHLFKRFYKGKNSDKNSLGIGLALSKSIIESQNGMIKAENNPSGGGKFIIKFYKR